MKILIDHPNPFMLAHGGFQIQIEQTKAALEAIQVDVEYMRWWDDSQKGDVIHYFGRPGLSYIKFAHGKRMRVIMAPLLTGMGSRPKPALFVQRTITSICRRSLPAMITTSFGWESFRQADACLALTAWEAHLMSYMFGVSPKKVHVVPNGIEDIFSGTPSAERGSWLICTATITERKRVLELSQAAVLAQTPLWVIGKAYNETDDYARAFFTFARQHPDMIRYEGPIDDREKLAKAYRAARGFVLLSTKESLSLSALEAAACRCPLLLSDLPWARTTFNDTAMYCPITSPQRTARVLREFHDAAPGLKLAPQPMSWTGVARQLQEIYATVSSTSR